MRRRKKIFLSASVLMARLNLKITKELTSMGYEVLRPQKIKFSHAPYEEQHANIYSQHIALMEAADLAVFVLDCHALDSTWEVGWFQGRQKPVIGWVQAKGLTYTHDWMVKLNAVVTPRVGIARYLRKVPVFGKAAVFHMRSRADLVAVVRQAIKNKVLPDG